MSTMESRPVAGTEPAPPTDGTDRAAERSTDAVGVLAGIEPFTRVDRSTLESLRDEVTWRSLARGETLVEAGSDARELSVVVDGELAVEIVTDGGERTCVAELGTGAVVGEVALLLGGRRTAAVVALTDTRVIDLTAEGFGDLLGAAPAVGIELVERATRRLRQTQLAGHLTRHLGPLEEPVFGGTLRAVEHVQLHAGEHLFDEGDEADAAFFVLSGRLRAVREDQDGEGAATTVAEIGPGELVGELALLDGTQRGATVVAVRDTALGRLPREVFDGLVTQHPSAMLGITRRLVARTRAPMPARRPSDLHRSIAVVPHTPDVDVRGFTAALVEALAADAFHLWSDRVEALLHRPGIARAERGGADDARLTHWLHEAEQDHRFLVLEADPTWSAWSDRACRQADEVLVVAHAATEDRSPGPLEERLGAQRTTTHAPRRTLVLLHDADAAQPADTAAWLDARQVDRHVHLRDGHTGDLGRLTRIVAGTATGLVLGGGGARGAAHLGVIRALREAGIPIDLYGGTSIGSVMAASGALEWPTEELVPRVSQALSGLLDYTLPMVSLLKGKRITRAIDDAAAGLDIEDLWSEYFCVSTNLTRQEEVVHRRGDLARAIRASVAIPGVLPPVPMGDDVLIDGGSMNNLPVDRMRESNPTGTVIAVDVAPPRGPSAKSDFRPVVSGWGQLAGRMIPGVEPVRVPGITVTMLGSTIVAAMRDRNAHVRAGLADLYLDLDLRGHGLLDFEATAEIAQAGYEAAAPRIEAWLEARGT